MAGQTSGDTRSGTAAEQPEDELLCTICGLTACWKTPGKAPATATAESPGAGASAPSEG